MKKYTYSLIALLVVTSTAGVLAQQSEKGTRGGKGKSGEMRALILECFDADKDGRLSESELAIMKAELTNKAGQRGAGRGKGRPGVGRRGEKRDCSAEDLSDCSSTERMFGNGERRALGKGAHGDRPTPEQHQKMLERFDINGDGQFSESERATMKAELFSRGGRRGMGNGEGRRGERPLCSTDDPQTCLSSEQKVGNGERKGQRKGARLTPEQHQKMLDRFDADGDGQLSDAERMTMRARFQQHQNRPQS